MVHPACHWKQKLRVSTHCVRGPRKRGKQWSTTSKKVNNSQHCNCHLHTKLKLFWVWLDWLQRSIKQAFRVFRTQIWPVFVCYCDNQWQIDWWNTVQHELSGHCCPKEILAPESCLRCWRFNVARHFYSSSKEAGMALSSLKNFLNMESLQWSLWYCW